MIKKMLALGMCAAVLSATAAIASAQDKENATKMAEVGEKAPSFSLNNLKGDPCSMSDYEGKVIVLEWTNPDCPFVEGVYAKGVVKETVGAMKEMGDDYVYISINSTANIPEKDVIKRNAALLKKNDVDIVALIDYDGSVGRMYGARTTPHMYVIDKEGILRYDGAFTSDFKKGTEATNYVVNALNQMSKDETVSPDQTKPWGCSVKYASK